jgi:hypothetical protein
MKHLRKFNESEKHIIKDNDDIIEYFTEWYDTDRLIIEDYLFNTKENQVVKKTPYVKNPKIMKECKVVTINAFDSNNLKGASLPGMSANCLTDINALDNIISDIKRFYNISGQEVNYTIESDYMGIIFKLVIITGDYDESKTKQKDIDELFKELNQLLIERRKRTTIKGNWFEIRGENNYSNTFFKLKRNMLLDNGTEFIRGLLQWYQKVQDRGMELDISGGDNQTVLNLKEI